GKFLVLLDAQNQVIRIRVKLRQFRVNLLRCPGFSHPQDTADNDQNQKCSQGLLHIVAMLVVFNRWIADVAGGMPELARISSSAASRLESGLSPFNNCCIPSPAAAPSRYLG